jgi:hypothetical protein
MFAASLLCGCFIDEDTTLLQEEENTLVQEDGNSGGQSANSSPNIGGNPPPEVLAGEFYEFEPVATDPDGDTLTFSISNKPNWAMFETATGRLYGQPTLDNVGEYGNIVIAVSDGSTISSLAAFDIAVTQVALGNVTLSWAAPTQNADGSPLTDLAGYNIYYGTSSGVYDHEISIDNPGTTTYVVDNLVPDTYYFAATSFNSTGVESEYSGEAVRTVN